MSGIPLCEYCSIRREASQRHSSQRLQNNKRRGLHNPAEKWARISGPFSGNKNGANKMSTHCWCSSFWSHFCGRKMAPDSGATEPGRFSNSLSQIAAPAGGSASDLISVLSALRISVGGCRASICLEGVYLWMKSRSISVIQTTMRHAKDLSDDNSTVHTSCFHTCSVCRHEHKDTNAHIGYSCSGEVFRLGPACSSKRLGR